MDDSHHTRFETELVGRLPAHQRDDPERSGLQLDLCYHAVLLDAGDDAAQAVLAEAAVVLPGSGDSASC
jgi:hypothetical protein